MKQSLVAVKPFLQNLSFQGKEGFVSLSVGHLLKNKCAMFL